MGKFQLKIDVEPKDIPELDDAHKRDCADALKSKINGVMRYTMIFVAVLLVFFGGYSLFSFTYLLRMNEMLPQVPWSAAIFAVLVFIGEFPAGMMKLAALIVEIILYACLVLSIILSASLTAIWLVPFAVYGAFLHVGLITLLPIYKVLSEQKGFPEFTSLPTKEEVTPKK
ncbi:MAG: hypothetical protein J6C96_11040 [Oscillospiraceae bacterium]|nr:hypothetical protein [Oscillospiraceae bacterium]